MALKVLLSGELAAPKTLARFQEESAAVRRLDHPNIVPVHEAGTIDGVHYFTMKFVEGDLFQALLKAKVPVLRGAEILRDVAHGAHHAHEHGIVHRDLKPANIIIERASGAPLIMDFGLAKDLESESGLSKTGVALGTPHYMPPEQALGKHREIDARADVYALGAMLYVVLAGKVPFNAESPGELLRRICDDDPVPPHKVRPDAPPDLETVALKALRKSKEDRYASARDFALDIERALAGKPVVADREAFWRPFVRRAARNPRSSVLVLACALVAAGSVAWGVRAAVEAERHRAEETALAEKAELERKKREAAEEAARVRAEAATSIAKGRTLREKARRAPSAANAHELLAEAAAALEKAVGRAPTDSDERAEALHEHATAMLELGPKSGWAAALDELAHAAGPVAARARLARGLHFLRREHDGERARKELEAASTIGGEKAERAAALTARAWLAVLGERTEDAVRDAREAATLSEELALLARETEVHARTLAVARPGNEAREVETLADHLVADEPWSWDAHLDRAWVHAIAWTPGSTNVLKHADESLAALRELQPETPEVAVVEALLAAVLSYEEGGVSDALAAARRAEPSASAHWDALERKVASTVDFAHRTRRRRLWGDFEPIEGADASPDVKSGIAKVQGLIARSRSAEAIALAERLEAAASPDVAVSLRTWRIVLMIDNKRGTGASEEALLGSVLAERPRDPFALAARVALCSARGDVAAARSACALCVAARPEIRTPRIVLAHGLLAHRGVPEIPDIVRPLWVADAADTEAGALLAYGLARADGKHEVTEAVAVARDVLVRDPTYVMAHVALSQALRKLEQHQEGLDHLDRALQVLKENWALLAERGLTLWCLGRYDEAEADIALAVKKSPTEKVNVESAFASLKKKRPRP